VERSLVQMRCALPLADHPGRGPTVETRPFRPGLDEEAWLITNNRAFASHPEQGQWELSTLLEREKEPWFDPDGLLLLEEGGRVAGSCWTKVHPDTDPPMGEIYVIGVDPDFHGRGWGRALTEAGLAWLSGRGLTVGMLYVDADNVAALSMYRSMGFAEDHVDRAYLGRFGPADGDIGSAGTHQMADGVGDGGGDTRDE
jgi:mycothiol synthase